jgi:hypothetical protein
MGLYLLTYLLTQYVGRMAAELIPHAVPSRADSWLSDLLHHSHLRAFYSTLPVWRGPNEARLQHHARAHNPPYTLFLAGSLLQQRNQTADCPSRHASAPGTGVLCAVNSVS